MKIAVASENSVVSEHFGHCNGFEVFEVENKEIVKNEFFENPGHKPGFLPNFLNDLGVNVVISGGMGAGATQMFNERGIEVVTGASGDRKAVVEKYIAGDLTSTGSICQRHEHKGECGGHDHEHKGQCGGHGHGGHHHGGCGKH